MTEIIKNIIINGSGQKPMGTDIFFEDNNIPKPVIIYAHGFNGFKDWGNFDIIAKRFASKGFVFVKFNFSHNGTTPELPEIFTDLEAFGYNNYTKQIEDLGLIIDWVCSPLNPYHHNLDINNISLIGHSMGGGISIIKAAEDARIKKLITWAAISECKTPWGNWTQDNMEEWKNNGVAFYLNSRTMQNMPLYYQLHQDYLLHETRLNIEKAIKNIHLPILICHGSKDPAVPVQAAYTLSIWQPKARLLAVESDHVFGRSHPWAETGLPEAMEIVVNESIEFLK